MDVEFFLHGVPHGQDYWGLPEERDYFSLFYNGNTEQTRLLIQVRQINGKSFSYYHYLVGNGIVDDAGRPGSYFGMTLRFDAYCSEVITMYRILDTVYHFDVLGHLLQKEGSKTVYTVAKFSNKGEYIEQIQRHAITLIQQTFAGRKGVFVAIDESFSLNGSSASKINLIDVDDDDIFKLIKSEGMVSLSLFYTTLREQQQLQKWREKLQEAEMAHSQTCEELRRANEHATTEIEKLKQQIIEEKAEITRLETELDTLHNRDVEQFMSQTKDSQTQSQTFSEFDNANSSVTSPKSSQLLPHHKSIIERIFSFLFCEKKHD